MRDPLVTYLNDHLAGAKFAVEMLEELRDSHAEPEINHLGGEILEEVSQDVRVLRELVSTLDTAQTGRMKEAMGWLGERAARMKLRHRAAKQPGTLESLELLALGIWGKHSLWTALARASANDPRLQGMDYDQLAARARSQYERVEAFRLRAAESELNPAWAASRQTRAGVSVKS